MDRIEALKHVLQDGGFFSEEEKRSALEALRDIAANGQTAFERETASATLKTIDGTPDSDSEISDHLLRLLYGLNATENTEHARELWQELQRTSER